MIAERLISLTNEARMLRAKLGIAEPHQIGERRFTMAQVIENLQAEVKALYAECERKGIK